MSEVRVCKRKDMDNRVVILTNVKTMLEWFVAVVLAIVIRQFNSITRLLVHVSGWLVQMISVWLVFNVPLVLAIGFPPYTPNLTATEANFLTLLSLFYMLFNLNFKH